MSSSGKSSLTVSKRISALVEESGGIDTAVWRSKYLGKMCVIFATLGLTNAGLLSASQSTDVRGPESLRNPESTWPNLAPMLDQVTSASIIVAR